MQIPEAGTETDADTRTNAYTHSYSYIKIDTDTDTDPEAQADANADSDADAYPGTTALYDTYRAQSQIVRVLCRDNSVGCTPVWSTCPTN